MNTPTTASMEPARDPEVRMLGLRGAVVVIVDDEETARFTLDHMIHGIDPGLSTFLFAGGAEALSWLSDHDPDLIITDWRMPGMTGTELIGKLRRDGRLQHVPVMMVTAADELAVRYQALDAGAVDFLAKPIDPLEIRTRCRNLLLLTHQYRVAKKYALLQEQKLQQLQKLLHTFAPGGTANLTERIERGELVTITYDDLFAVTSCVAGIEVLVHAAQRTIVDLEHRLATPLRGTLE